MTLLSLPKKTAQKTPRLERWIEELATEDSDRCLAAWHNIKETLITALEKGYDPNDLRLAFDLEEVIVGLLGHYIDPIRNEAVKFLNVLYDGHTLQLEEALPVAISCVGEKEKLSIPLHKDARNVDASSVQLRITISNLNKRKASQPYRTLPSVKAQWKEIPVRIEDDKRLACDLPEFPSTGFYDWYITPVGSTNPIDFIDVRRTKGRFVVHPKGTRHEMIYEVPVDQVGAAWDEATGQLKTRGTFDNVLSLLPEIKVQGFSSIYVMGALQRPRDDPDAAPFNVADRQNIATRLGGPEAFANLVKEINRLEMKPIIDGIERVSRWAHRKYRGIGVYTLDSRKVTVPHGGTDGRENEWNDSILPNYRDVAMWNLMIDEIKAMAKQFSIKGVRLDNCQSYPVIMAPDTDTLFGVDPDGQLHHTKEEIFYGAVVQKNVESGYWTSAAALEDDYPNPFLIKLCRELWDQDPDFTIIGESFFYRSPILSASGVIPHSIILPQVLASISGNSLRRDGSVAKLPVTKRATLKTLGRILRNESSLMPTNAIQIRSTCTHLSPYPSVLYGRRAWIAVDLMSLLPGIPLQLYGEDLGLSFRMNMGEVIFREEETAYDTNFNKLLPKSPKKEKKEVNTGSDSVEGGMSKLSLSSSKGNLQGLGQKKGSFLNMSKNMSSNKLASLDVQTAAMVRKRSEEDMKKMGVRSVSKQDLQQIENMSRKVREEIGPNEGFDITQIKGHYNHRLLVRSEYDLLKDAEFCGLNVEAKFKEQVFAFARFDSEKIIIVAMNMKDQKDGPEFGNTVHAEIILTNLLNALPESVLKKFDSLVHPIDCFEGQPLGKEIYTLEEILFRKFIVELKPLSTAVITLENLPSTPENLEKHYKQCLSRLQMEANEIHDPRENHILASLTRGAAQSITDFASALEKARKGFTETGMDVQYFMQLCLQRSSALYYNVLYEGLIPPQDYEPPTGEKIISYLSHLTTACSNKDLLQMARSIVTKCQKIGPIVFAAPEIGRFSTAGGLGVMVDELSKCLADFGLEVYVISPYYTVNRKNQTGYLGPGFNWSFNVDINLGNEVVPCGIFEGKEDGVNYIFIERGDLFPKVYADPGSAERMLKSIILMSLGGLEACCKKGLAPAVYVTNDWLPSMSAAYAKQGFFGSFFQDTTFFHLIHNLGDGSYEGRIYPSPGEGTMDYIHRLPPHLLVDFSWQKTIINPSRCALLCTDSWGTVSQSYLKELKSGNALCHLLQIAKSPFAYPNGIRQKDREKQLQERAAPDHLTAKKYLQQKYFGFQDVDPSIPLFAFVGRITSQKGVHLILNAVDEMMRMTNQKIQILVGGPATYSDPYSAGCARHCHELLGRYRGRFWAAPDDFFTDGPLVNLGADFGLMPSIFEPGGIVQQEFFVAGTPVVAFKTGGLKDTVHEWNSETMEGNGFTFEGYTHGDFIWAIKRALKVFSKLEEYQELRQSAYETTIDVTEVAWAWSSEFHRLKDAIYASAPKMQQALTETAGEESEWLVENSRVVKFEWTAGGRNVFVKGSFDGWTQNWPLLSVNGPDGQPSDRKVVTLRLPVGEYAYKFSVDGNWVLADDQPKKEEGGYLNNIIIVQ